MAAYQEKLQLFQKKSQKNILFDRVHGMIDQYIVSDLKNLLQPGHDPGPLVTAVVLGTILSFIPAPFLDSFLVGVLVIRFRQLNRAAILAARLVWNDLIVVPLYWPSFRLGLRLLEPYSANNPTFTTNVLAFSLGLMLLTAAATFLSAALMLVVVVVLERWQQSSSCC